MSAQATPRRTRGRSWRVAALLGLAVAIGAGAWGWRHTQTIALLHDSVPATPDLSGWPAELKERIHEAERQVQSGRHAADALGEVARLYHANGFLAEARQCYEGLETLEPARGEWPYRHAMIVSGFGEMELAMELLRKTVKLAPDYLQARLRLGDILLKENRTEEAVAVFQEAQEKEPGEAYSLLGLARCDMERRDWSAARQRLERVVEATNYSIGYDLIVTVYERLGMKERADQLRGRMKAWGTFRDMADPWMEELNGSSYDSFQLSVAAGALKARGEKDAARRTLERAISLSPNNASLRFQLALLLMERGENQKARVELERCTQLAPTFADGWAYLSGVLSSLGETAAAQQVFEAGLVHCPDSPGLHRMRAGQLRSEGKFEEAAQHYRTAIRLRPTEADPYIDLALTLMKLGRNGEAVEEFHRALIAEPEHPMVLSALAFHAISNRDEAGARDWLARAGRQPRFPAAELEMLNTAFAQAFGHLPN